MRGASLDLNDEAAHAVRGADLKGELRLGVQEDFGESLLTPALGSFARANPRVRIEARLARNADLLGQVELGRLDLAVAWDSGKRTAHTRRSGNSRCVGWERASHMLPNSGVARGRCRSRCSTVSAFFVVRLSRALEKARIPWRLAFTSPSLSGVWAAVAAGLGVTVRTRAGRRCRSRCCRPRCCRHVHCSRSHVCLESASTCIAPRQRGRRACVAWKNCF